MRDTADILKLAELCGIEPSYIDVWNKQHTVSPEIIAALLSDMGLAVDSPEQIRAQISSIEEQSWRQLLAPVQLVKLGQAEFDINLSIPESYSSGSIAWTLTSEETTSPHKEPFKLSGESAFGGLQIADSIRLNGQRLNRYILRITTPKHSGYYKFTAQIVGARELGGEMSLIVVPHYCYLPRALGKGNRIWGPSVQVYALRSERNWGVGDFTDLQTLAETAGKLGADIIAVNPLHALFPHNPTHASPYSPSNRQFRNIFYLDVERIEDFVECEPAQQIVREPQFQSNLEELRRSDLVDYRAVATAKMTVLRSLFEHFLNVHLKMNTERAQRFRSFQSDSGEALRKHALFEALQEKFHSEDPNLWGWPAWPQAYHDPGSSGVEEFAKANPERIEFYEYLQWQTEIQLSEVAQSADELNQVVGLYQDIALSMDRGGAEAWTNQKLLALNTSIGAPGDEFSPEGQNWGLPPYIPTKLRDAAYKPFIEILRRNMRYAGALRMDHVMGLMRLFWKPAGAAAEAGAYVRYPLEDLLGILALESHRNRCLVIGEDLGTVPESLREILAQMNVLSYRILYFEKDQEGRFKAPVDYPEKALVAINTHDLPSLAGFWRGYDLKVRSELDLLKDEITREKYTLERTQERAALLMALKKEELLPPDITIDPASAPEMSDKLMHAVHRYIARTPAKIMAVPLENVVNQLEQINLPGTTQEYPNWRRKFNFLLNDSASLTLLRGLSEEIAKERGEPHPSAYRSKGIKADIPRATYRLQLNGSFPLTQATALVDYLNALGVSHCYTSPYLKARPGSSHGYDVVDHNALNPEIGSSEDLDDFIDELSKYEMGHILDIVPNHMGVLSNDNSWWLDVLENGPASVYSGFFDIDWDPIKDELRGKVLLPVLGDHYGRVLTNADLKLVFDKREGSFSVYYYSHRFPISPKEYPRILSHRMGMLEIALGVDHPRVLELQSLITSFGHLPGHQTNEQAKIMERNRDKDIHKQHLASLCAASDDVTEFIEKNVAHFNGLSGQPESFALLHDLLQRQAYRLSFWRVASDEINYRRFFDINALAALRMENETVFEVTHQFIFSLIRQNKINGLRVDHPDGLYHPAQYYQKLQSHIAPMANFANMNANEESDTRFNEFPFYVVIEKILAGYEQLPAGWSIFGTTGYDFMSLVNGIFVDTDSEKSMTEFYKRFTGNAQDFATVLYRSKKQIMSTALASELNVLAQLLNRISERDWNTRDYTVNNIREALSEVIAYFPIYRTYVTTGGASEDDRRYVEWAVKAAKKRSTAVDLSIYDFIQSVLVLDAAEDKNQVTQSLMAEFAMKFQQVSSPAMAKGAEDTAFYNYYRLVSLNDVGSDPAHYGVSLSAFHHANLQRAKRWPHSMLTTSTHDNKRSEDVRARINVLSEIPNEWRSQVRTWARLNRSKKYANDGVAMPSKNDEYLFYQTLIGAWPLNDLDQEGLQAFCQRIADYMLKAAREAKAETGWVNPNAEYEAALLNFVRSVLDKPEKNLFLSRFLEFSRSITRAGLFNSLSQTLIKFTAPGVPDIYQGNEIWDFSLVDPDNRRAVDYAARRRLLDGLREAEKNTENMTEFARSLLDSLEDGRIKMYSILRILELRRTHSDLFRCGSYIPLPVTGPAADHICAYARTYGQCWAIAVAPRFFTRLLADANSHPIGTRVWQNTAIELPDNFPETYLNIFTQEEVTKTVTESKATIAVAEILPDFPIALLFSSS